MNVVHSLRSAVYINFVQIIHQIQVLTEPLCRAQAIPYAITVHIMQEFFFKTLTTSLWVVGVGHVPPAPALSKKTYSDRVIRPPAFLKS